MSVAVQPHHLILAAAKHKQASRTRLPWRDWLARYFPTHTNKPFAERHVRFWEWATALEPGVRPRARVECWPRGGGKSSTIELACTYLGAHPEPVRHYVLYVSGTQTQANKHVQSIAANLESVGVRRATNEYGLSKGWRHEEIRTANNFNITAFGLDVGMRGVKLDEYRPDIIIFDDIDGRHDTPETVRKHIDVITTTILPSGSSDVAVVFVQNKIAKNSIMSQLCDGHADFLHDRIPATVEPAVRDLTYRQVIRDDGMPRYEITGGTPTWEGQNLQTCENQINEWGIGAFRREAQHEVDEVEGGLWQRERDIHRWRTENMPPLDRIVIAVDPNTSEGNDDGGVIAAGVSNLVYDKGVSDFRWHPEKHGFVLEDATVPGGPKVWAEAAVAAYHKYRADALVAEKNNGGDMVRITVSTIPGAPRVDLVWASRGKITRAEPVQKLYEDGRVHHVGTFPELESEMCTWRPPRPSPNRMDALVWAMTELMLDGNEGGFTMGDVMAAMYGGA